MERVTVLIAWPARPSNGRSRAASSTHEAFLPPSSCVHERHIQGQPTRSGPRPNDEGKDDQQHTHGREQLRGGCHPRKSDAVSLAHGGRRSGMMGDERTRPQVRRVLRELKISALGMGAWAPQFEPPTHIKQTRNETRTHKGDRIDRSIRKAKQTTPPIRSRNGWSVCCGRCCVASR